MIPSQLTLSRWHVAVPAFALMTSLAVYNLVAIQGRPFGALAFIGVAASVLLIARPMYAAGAMIATSLFLQLAHVGVAYADQIDIAQAGLERVLAGNSPYGVLLPNDRGGLNPFPYGPLSLITSIGGRALEVVATTGVMGVLAWQRAWITLALLAASPMVVQSAIGGNEGVPTLLLVAGFVVLRTRPRHGMLLLALAGAVKPHVAAWFLPGIGVAGWSAGGWLIGASAVLWSPILVFGVGNFLTSARAMYELEMTGFRSLGLDLPWARYFAAPVMLAGLWVRRWDRALLLGAAAYTLVMFFGAWAHEGYLTVLVVTVGLALESGRGAAPRTARRGSVHLAYRSRRRSP